MAFGLFLTLALYMALAAPIQQLDVCNVFLHGNLNEKLYTISTETTCLYYIKDLGCLQYYLDYSSSFHRELSASIANQVYLRFRCSRLNLQNHKPKPSLMVTGKQLCSTCMMVIPYGGSLQYFTTHFVLHVDFVVN